MNSIMLNSIKSKYWSEHIFSLVDNILFSSGLITCYILLSSIPRDSHLRSCEHLHGLHFPEVSESCIYLLIGAGAVQVHYVVDARLGSRCSQPTAFRTGVGWVLMGPDELMPSNKECYLCLSCCNAGRLNDKMQQLFEQDFREKSANIEFPLSVKD